MPHQEPERNRPLAPLELITQFPGVPCASSDQRRWVGLEARQGDRQVCNDQEKVLAFPFKSPLRRCPGLFS
jgi:hypothetical protein